MSSVTRFSLSLLSGIFLLASPLMAVAGLTKEISPTLKACQATCKSEKDAKAYEGCMLKCGEAEKPTRNPVKGK